MSRIKVESNKIKWLKNFAVMAFFWNIMVYLCIIISGDNEMKEEYFLFFNLFLLICFAFSYIRHTKSVQISNGNITIKTNLGTYSDKKENYYIVEKQKLTRTLHRYKVMVIVNKRTRKKHYIDSDDWKDYDKLYSLLCERNSLDDKRLNNL